MALAIKFINTSKNFNGPKQLLEVLKQFVASIASPNKNVLFWVRGQKLILQHEADRWLKQINGVTCTMQYQFKVKNFTIQWFSRQSEDSEQSVAYQIDANKLAKAMLCFKNDLKSLVIIFRNKSLSLLELISSDETRATITISAQKKIPSNIEFPHSIQIIEEFKPEIANSLLDWKNFKIILHPQTIQLFDKIKVHTTKSEKFKRHALPSYNYDRLMMHLADRNIITTNAGMIVQAFKFNKTSEKTPVGLYVLLKEPSDASQLIIRIDNQKYTYVKNFVCSIACMEGRPINRTSPLIHSLKRNEEEEVREEAIRVIPVPKKQEHKPGVEQPEVKKLDLILERIAQGKMEQERRKRPLMVKPQFDQDELMIEDDDDRWQNRGVRKSKNNQGH